MTVTTTRPWWKDAVIYQIYPASFKDGNGDGLGDVQGIISKLDYLKDVGADVIWVCPMYDSPQVDMGYDIRDYEAVYPPYGTVADMQTLIEETHKRGMKLILDLVVNHTSNQHAWFQESRSSKTNSKRDWYIWRPARYDENGNRMPPNNWKSYFSGSVWEWDESTQEYYLHLFAKEQPDLNWENPETREAIYNSAMRFWLDKGVDGFRIDTVNMYSKPPGLPDAPITDPNAFEQEASALFCNGPRMHEFLREMNQEVLNHYDTMTVGELPATPDFARVLKYVSASDKQLSMVFQFDIVDLGNGYPHKYDFVPWTLPRFKTLLCNQQTFHEGSDGWTCAFIENHDQGRSVSRFASDSPEHRERSAKMLATMMTTLTGTLFVYQGQEIGMINAPGSWPISDYQDIEALNYFKTAMKRANGDQAVIDHAMRSIQLMGRDHARLPMQWDSTANAGFTTVAKPWMRVHDLYPEINAAKQAADPNSVLSFWKSMISLRKQYKDLFTHGSFELHEPDNNSTFIFSKTSPAGQKALTVLNFTDKPQAFKKPAQVGDALRLAVTNYGNEEAQEDILRPYEGRLYLPSHLPN